MWISFAPINLLILALVLMLGAILLRFSKHYMAGDSAAGAYHRWFLITLGAVMVTVLANHVVLFVAGWTSISIGFHRLLTLYSDRPRALLAAHKKFLLARLAELALVVAFVLIYLQHGHFLLSDIAAHYRDIALLNLGSLTVLDQISATLFVTAALIKCAQLPFHGWLINVVEAPTPVSALLHAGIINLGGYMLIQLSPLIMLSASAYWLLVIVAGVSLVASALIMTTRISIKVNLAWSTSAQMALMLIEIALGLYELALLHLIAHSFYKAHAFLNSGSAVLDYGHEDFTSKTPPKASHWFIGMLVSTALVTIAYQLTATSPVLSPWLVIGIALVGLFAEGLRINTLPQWIKLMSTALLLLAGYVIAKTMFSLFIVEAAYTGFVFAADLLIAGLLVVLCSVQGLLRYQAHRPWVRRIAIALYAGLYIDEWFTRLTLKLWPIQLPTTHQKVSFAPSVSSTLTSKENAS